MTVKPQTQCNSARPISARTLLVGLGLALAIVVSFWPVLTAQFINYDDQDYVTENPRVQAGLTRAGVAWAFTTFHASNWHPLTWISHQADVEIFGKGPAGPHAVNLALHVANTLLLLFLLRTLTASTCRSAVVAALFGLHPLHVESVAWVAERKDVLSTFFGLLALITYAGYARGKVETRNSKLEGNPKFERESGGGGLWGPSFWSSITHHASFFYVLALLLLALGLMCKPMLVTWPCLMLLLDYWPLGRNAECGMRSAESSMGVGNRGWWPTFLRLVAEKAPFFALSAAACVLTTRAQAQAIQSLEHLPFGERVTNALVSYVRYLFKAFWPVDLALPYVHPGTWPAIDVGLAGLLIAGLCLAAILAASRYPYVFTGWFWFLGTMVPVIGLVQVGAQSMADRYTYVPMIGVFIVVVWGGAEACRHLRIPWAYPIGGAIVGLVVCGVLTRAQARVWRDSERLFKHSAAVTKGNFIALGNLGGALFKQGRLDEALEVYQQAYQINPRYAEAANSIGAVLASRDDAQCVGWFRKALELQPSHADALFNLGNAMAKRGNASEARDYFQESLRYKPDNFEALNNLGNALVSLGQIDEAIVCYRSALELRPDAALIHKNLGEMLAAKGRLGEAIAQYQQVFRYTNDASSHYSLALTLAVQQKWEPAIEQFSETLRLAPTNADAHYNLGFALRVTGRLEPAATHLRQALRLKPEFPLAHYNLGCILADQGDRDGAARQLREALRLNPDYADARQKLKALEQ